MYDFSKETNRFNTTSLKWDVKESELPMWVADMDFEVCPEILKAMRERFDNHIFGYNIIPDEWYNAYILWWKNKHNYVIDKDWLLFSTGVVPSISSIVRRLTLPGEKVLIQTPVYNIFFNSIINNGRFVLESPLKYENHEYSIDFKDLEEKLSDPQVSLMILCNPHNPIGKIWDKETLERIGHLCVKYNVVVISDEIHCDITNPGVSYVPFQSVSEECRMNSIMCIAPTKAFNIAGLQTSALCIPNPVLRHRVNRGLNNDEIAEGNTFACVAAIAAFNQGSSWNEEMREYIYNNKQYVSTELEKNLPSVYAIKQDSTYLMWVDVSAITGDSVKLTKYIREKTGLYISDGEEYGESGRCFVRINVATQFSRVKDGTKRFIDGIKMYIKDNK